MLWVYFFYWAFYDKTLPKSYLSWDNLYEYDIFCFDIRVYVWIYSLLFVFDTAIPTHASNYNLDLASFF